MKRTSFFLRISAIVIICVSIFSSCGEHHRRRGGNDVEQKDTTYPLGFWTDTLRVVEGNIQSGDNFTAWMGRLGLPSANSYPLLQACGETFDVRKMRAGNSYEAYYTADSLRLLQYVVYHNNRLDMTIFRCFDSLAVWKYTKPTEKVRRYADVTIESSLIADMIAGGSSTAAAYKLADIYAWTVDFFGLQKGDRFRMIYDEIMCDGEAMDVDTVFFALCNHAGKEFPAIMYDQGDGGNRYWNEKGESLKKAFLKAPLNFTRISSGYTTHRLHPVTRKVQPHLAVDYAAPTGTPVWSIGDGVVLSAGYSGAAGNMIKIKHNGTYTTAYLHLSKYASGIKAGAHVRQGQIIGYVGSTGRSTGPHLDFRVYKNGSPINPLKMESPSAEPIKKENLPALDSLYRHYMAQLN